MRLVAGAPEAGTLFLAVNEQTEVILNRESFLAGCEFLVTHPGTYGVEQI
jgi:hypothetical protein